MLGALLLFGDQMLTPIQILWVNLVTDSLLVIPLGLEPPEQKILREKPEHKDAAILSSTMVIRMIIIAIVMSCLTIITYFIAKQVLHSGEQANTLAFTALVVMQWSNAISARGIYESAWQRVRIRHHSFLYAFIIAILLQFAALFGPLGALVNTVSVPALALAITVVVAFIIPLVVAELHKKLSQRQT